jgi:hypothetical protein
MTDDVIVMSDGDLPEGVETVDTNVEPVTPDLSSSTQDDTSLLANKFKDTESLEAGYIELQKKLSELTAQGGDKGEDTKTPPSNPLTLPEDSAPTPEDADTKGKAPKTASELLDTFEETFATEGELTDEQVKQLEKKGMSKADAELLLNTRKEKAEKELNDLLEPVGGLDEWIKITEYLKENMDEATQQEFNEAMLTGNNLMKSLLIQHAKETVDNEQGVAPTNQTTGDSTKVTPSTDSFATQRDMAKAVGDPRYINDPVYRAEVDAKIARSDVNKMNGY